MMSGLYLIALGSGGIKPVSAHVGDQLERAMAISCPKFWMVLYLNQCWGVYIDYADAMAAGMVWATVGIWDSRSINGDCHRRFLDGPT